LRLETLSFFDEPKKVPIKLLETLARLLNVERLKIYTPLELFEAIVHSTEPEGLFNKLAIQIRYRKLFGLYDLRLQERDKENVVVRVLNSSNSFAFGR